MALTTTGELVVSDLDPVNREAIEKELWHPSSTDLCVCNNRKGPTDKRVMVHMWTNKPSTASFKIPLLASGETRITYLSSLKLQVIAFEIRWQIPSTGSPMWGTTGKIHAAPGTFVAAFGIRWDEHDHYSVIYPDQH